MVCLCNHGVMAELVSSFRQRCITNNIRVLYRRAKNSRLLAVYGKTTNVTRHSGSAQYYTCEFFVLFVFH
jgi:hypothetical protein